jgi:RNA-directed DNA polymerase
LLANVYLHELDEFMTTYKARFDRGTVRRQNPEHKRLRSLLSDRRRRVERLGTEQETEKERLLGEIRDLQKALLRLPNPKDPFDPGYRRLLYVRYADDFLIGVIGSKQDARDIMEAVRSHLKGQLNLEVSDEKSGIAAASEGASFLGYTVKARTYDRVQRIRRKDSGWTMLRRDPSRTIQLHVPHEKLAAFVKRRRLGSYYTMCGEPRNELKNSSDLEVITRYGLELRGLAEYYKLAVLWKEELSRVRRIWWFSLMKTLGHKHKCSVVRVIREILDHQRGKYGVRYESKDSQKFREVFRLKHVSDGATTYRTVDEIRDYPFLGMSRTDLLDRLRAKQCESCGLTDVPLEIHHARRLSDISHQSLAAQLVAAKRRKRLALCQPCHRALHNGTLTARLHQMKAEVGAG